VEAAAFIAQLIDCQLRTASLASALFSQTISCCLAFSSPSMQGSWEFNQNVYDYSASQPMANVLSWEAPRLVCPQPDCSPLPAGHH
jgi:hypothetical protein